MNAGDELRLLFKAPPPPPAGQVRDYVLIGDGWVKDGDLNTTYSKTVLPPFHGQKSYNVAPTNSRKRSGIPAPSIRLAELPHKIRPGPDGFHSAFRPGK